MESTSHESQGHDQEYGPRKVKVTFLAYEWRSSKGGLSTINKELAIQLAKSSSVEITFFLPQCSDEHRKEALRHNVHILKATRQPGFEEREWLSFPPEHLQIDVIVGHGLKLGRQALVIRQSHKCKWVQVIHTDSEELGMFKSYPNTISTGEQKHSVEVELCELADFVVGIGPKLSEAFSAYLRRFEKNQIVFDLTPGVLDEFMSVNQVPKEGKHRSILLVGRGDPEDFQLKGFDIAARAVASLPDTYLVFFGAPNGDHEEITQRFLSYEVPANRLRVRSYDKSRESLKGLFREVDLVLMPSRTEGFGLTGLEALSAGLPVLISQNSGFGEALRKVPFGSSFVIDSEDPEIWAAAIKKIWEKERKTRLREAETLRATYAEEYSWTKQSDALLSEMINLARVFLHIKIECEAMKRPGAHVQEIATGMGVKPQEPLPLAQSGVAMPPNTSKQAEEVLSQSNVGNERIPSADEILRLIAFKYLQAVDPSKPEEFNGYLDYLERVRKVLLVDVQQGSLIITVEIRSLQILEELWEDYSTGHLNEMAQKFLATEDVLEESGLSELRLTTTIAYEEYRACQDFFERSDFGKINAKGEREDNASGLNPTVDSTNKAQVSQQFTLKARELPMSVDPVVMEYVTSTTHYDQLKKALVAKKSEIQWKPNDDKAVIVYRGEDKSDSWQLECIAEAQTYFGKWTTRDVEVDKDFWEAVKRQLSNIVACLGVDPPLVKPIDDAFVLKIASLSTDAQNVADQLKTKLEELYREETRKTYVTMTINVAVERLILLKKIKFAEKLQENNKKLVIKLDTEAEKIYCEGPRPQIIEAITKFHKLDLNIVENNLKVSKSILEVLGTDEGLQRVKCELEKNNIEAVFVTGSEVRIVGTSAVHEGKAVSLVSKLTSEDKVRVDYKSQYLLKTAEWRQLCKDLNTKVVRVYQHESSDTFVAGFREDVSEAMKILDAFLESNYIRHEQFHCSSELMRRYLSEFCQNELRCIETELENFKVSIQKGKADDSFVISGKKEGLKQVNMKLQYLQSVTMSATLHVKQPGLRKFCRSEEGDSLIKSIERGHACLINVQTRFVGRLGDTRTPDTGLVSENDYASAENDDQDDEDEKEEEEADEEAVAVYKTGPSFLLTSNGHKISWRAGRMECEEANILVCSNLPYGQERGQNSANHRNTCDMTVIPRLGTLACCHEIRTNYLEWNGGNGERVLPSIVQKCLLLGEELGGTSIEFPVIGIVNVNFPPVKASTIMLEESIRFCHANPTSTLKSIRFVLPDRDNVLRMAYITEFENLQFSLSYPVVEKLRMPNEVLQRALSRKTADPPGVIKKPSLSIEVENGDLTQEKTEAIINIISSDMNMKNAGELSKAILRMGGPQIQQECSQLGKQTPGSAVMTSGGRLAVPCVIHIIPGSADKHHLQTCLEAGLRLADTLKLRSISIPSIGTGGFGLAAADSAQITFKAIDNFSGNCNSVRKVRVIVFQTSLMQEFLQAQKRQALKQDADDPGRKSPSEGTPTRQSRKRRSKLSTPKILSNDLFVKIVVIGKDLECVKKAVDSLKKGYYKDYPTQKVEDDTVSQFSQRQIRTLMKQANDRDVSLEIESDMNRVVVSGELTEMLDMVNQIWRVINKRNEKIQKELVMKNIEWSFEIRGMKSTFDPETNTKIETAYSKDQATVTVASQVGKFFIDFESKIGIEQLSRKTIKVFRKLKGADEGIPLPKDWEPLPHPNVTVHKVTLSPSSSEYQDVMCKVQATASGVNIQKIERVQNPYLYQCYMMRKKEMDKTNPGNNERQLFHGTDAKNIPAINSQGFNRSFCGVHGTNFGQGVYFARDASYSVNYAGRGGDPFGRGAYFARSHYYSARADYARGGGEDRHMYLSRVLVGTYCKGNSSMIVPPPKNPSRPEILYDSVVDNTENATIFAVFSDNQCYPEYLITFK